MKTGWLLDASINYERHMLTLWIKSQGTTRGYLYRFHPALYVKTDALGISSRSDKTLLNDIMEHPLVQDCSIVERFVSVCDSQRKQVLEAKTWPDTLQRLARDLEKLPGAVVFHADIDAVQQFFITEDMFPFGKIAYDERSGQIIRLENRDQREKIEYETPVLEEIRFDVIAKTKRAVPSPMDPIDCFNIYYQGRVISIRRENEHETIAEFQRIVNDIDPDVIVTVGGDDELFNYIIERARVNGLELVLSRDGSPLRAHHREPTSFWQYNQIVYRPSNQVMLIGRIHIDVGSSMYYSPEGMEGVIEGCRLAHVQPQRVARMSIGTVNAAIQYYNAFKRGILIPPIKRNPEFLKSLNDLAVIDRGGLIFQPRPDIYEDVAECDFSSMFPTLMVTRNIGPETICIREDCQYADKYCIDVPGVNFRLCSRKRGIVAESLDLVLRKRSAYKKLIEKGHDAEKYSRIQNTLKMILVSCFGYLGFRNARFGRVEAHAAVTALAREIMLKTQDIAEGMGLELIHGIVDSVWLKSRNRIDADTIEEFCKRVSETVEIDMSMKGIYRWLVIPSSRTVPSVAPLNRYYGVFQNGAIKTRGIETRRSDTCRYVRDCQMSMIKALAEARNKIEFIEAIPRAYAVCLEFVEQLHQGDVDIRDLFITSKISRDPDDYHATSRAAIVARQLVNAGKSVHAGQRVRYVIVESSASNPTKRVKAIHLLEVGDRYDPVAYSKLCVRAFENLIPTQYLKSMSLERGNEFQMIQNG